MLKNVYCFWSQSKFKMSNFLNWKIAIVSNLKKKYCLECKLQPRGDYRNFNSVNSCCHLFSTHSPFCQQVHIPHMCKIDFSSCSLVLSPFYSFSHLTHTHALSKFLKSTFHLQCFQYPTSNFYGSCLPKGFPPFLFCFLNIVLPPW